MAQVQLEAVISARDNASSTFKRVGKSFDNYIKIGALAATAGLVAFGVAAIKSAANVQMMRTNLDTLTGSAKKGGEMFSKLYKMAAKTPFETKDLVQATQTMLSFGIAQKKILPNLKMIGDVALGNKFKFTQLSEAFSQVSAKGKLQGEQLERLITVGFNPLQIIADKTGESYTSLFKKMSEGKISFDMVSDAMKIATSEGGRFYQGMEKGSKTLEGTWSTLRDNITMLSIKLVGLSEKGDVVKGGLFDKISIAVNNLNTYFETHQKDIDIWTTNFTNSVTNMVTAVGNAIKWLRDFWNTSFGKVMISAIVILIVTIAAAAGSIGAIAALIIGTIVLLVQTWRQYFGLLGDLWILTKIRWQNFVNSMSNLISILRNIVSSKISAVIAVFRSIPGRIAGALSSLYGVITSPFRNAIQAVRNLWNSTIGGRGFSVPGWVPKIGGRNFTIPTLQTGGIVPRTGMAYLHKGEYVKPQGAYTSGGSAPIVNIYGSINMSSNQEIDAVAKRLARQLQLSSQAQF